MQQKSGSYYGYILGGRRGLVDREIYLLDRLGSQRDNGGNILRSLVLDVDGVTGRFSGGEVGKGIRAVDIGDGAAQVGGVVALRHLQRHTFSPNWRVFVAAIQQLSIDTPRTSCTSCGMNRNRVADEGEVCEDGGQEQRNCADLIRTLQQSFPKNPLTPFIRC